MDSLIYSAWPNDRDVITTQDLYTLLQDNLQKSDILSEEAFKSKLVDGVRNYDFGYGVLWSEKVDQKYIRDSYRFIYFGEYDAKMMYENRIFISQEAVLIQVETLEEIYPSISTSEFTLMLTDSRQTVKSIFRLARYFPGLEARVDNRALVRAIQAGTKEGLFHYEDDTGQIYDADHLPTADEIKPDGFIVILS